MGKKILLPTDFSKNSWNAIKYAVKLHENQECDFFLLNTYMTEAFGLKSVMLESDESLNKISEMKSKQGLEDFRDRLMDENPNSAHKFFIISRAFTLLEVVEELATDLSIDLIVMGAKGNSSKRERKYGANTLEIIENIRKCPVLVIPINVSFDHPKEIVLATNFDTDYKESAIKYLADLAKINGASIQILSLAENGTLSTGQKKNKMVLQQYLKDIDHRFTVLSNVKISEALSSFMEINESNLISYIDKKPSLWKQLGFGKPSLRKLGYYENVPVLALHG